MNLINPNGAAAQIRLELMGGDSPLVGELMLPPNGVARLDAAEFFTVAAAELPDVAYIIARSNVEIAGFEFVRGAGDLLGLNARPASEQLNTLFFPQLAVLEPFQTELVVVNYDDQTVIVTITAHRPDGTLYGVEQLRTNPVTRALNAGAVLRENVEELFGFFGAGPLDGWLEVTSTSESINGTLSYAIPENNSLAALTSVAQGCLPHRRISRSHFR